MELKETKDAALDKMQAQLQEAGTKLDGLIAKAETSGKQSNEGYRRKLMDLNNQRQLMQARLSELKASGGVKWTELKQTFSSDWDKFVSAVKELKEEASEKVKT